MNQIEEQKYYIELLEESKKLLEKRCLLLEECLITKTDRRILEHIATLRESYLIHSDELDTLIAMTERKKNILNEINENIDTLVNTLSDECKEGLQQSNE